MNETKVSLSLRKMLLYVLPPAAACWAIGAWPTHQYGGGRMALAAQAWAFGTALVVVLGRVAFVKAMANRAQAGNTGKTNVAFIISQTFLAAGMINIFMLAGLGSAVWYFLSLPVTAFFLWMVGFYMVMLAGETWWLSITLKQFSPKADNSSDVGGG